MNPILEYNENSVRTSGSHCTVIYIQNIIKCKNRLNIKIASINTYYNSLYLIQHEYVIFSYYIET